MLLNLKYKSTIACTYTHTYACVLESMHTNVVRMCVRVDELMYHCLFINFQVCFDDIFNSIDRFDMFVLKCVNR